MLLVEKSRQLSVDQLGNIMEILYDFDGGSFWNIEEESVLLKYWNIEGPVEVGGNLPAQSLGKSKAWASFISHIPKL